VDGAEWSEGEGFHRGFFSSFRIRAGKAVWFHVPFPTPTELQGSATYLDAVSLLFETLDGAQINWMVLQHGGMERLPLTERLREPPAVDVPFDPPELWREYYPASSRRLSVLPIRPRLPMQFGVQLCVMVTAPDAVDGLVRFYGAGVDFADKA